MQSYSFPANPPNIFEGIFEEKFLLAEYEISTDDDKIASPDERHMDIRSEGTKGVRSGELEVRVS